MVAESLTVLLVDDDPIIRHQMQRWAERAGFQWETAADGVEGLAQVRRFRPDLIVTDVHMPRMQGPRLVELVRTIPGMKATPIIVVTADASRDTKISLLQNGADDFILKPIDGEEFTARLRALARRCDINSTLELVQQERDAARQALQERADELERLMFGLITALEQASAFNDDDTGNHIRRVAAFSGLLAEELGCPPALCSALRRYAGLHDVGKVGIPDTILRKTGRLTPEELEEMKAHTLIGADLLRTAGLPPVAVNIALCHHERWDGSGYPRGLRGPQIPLEARIVAVADVYDALRSERGYKPSMSVAEATAFLREQAGVHFDPALIERFLGLQHEIAAIEAKYTDESWSDAAEQVWA
jgi:putative nucleotidyltransferase with HDIG domain